MNVESKILETFNYLHTNAELSWEEVETTTYLKDVLEAYGCETETFTDVTGVIGKYGNFDGKRPVVALRGDMDALHQEVDGVLKANHSCGHDSHMSMVLGALWLLQKHPEWQDKVAVKLIFQPAEELGDGALKMVEKGAVDDVDYLFGIHLRPKVETPMGVATPVIIHGATGRLEIELKGEEAHGGRPHLNKNAVDIGVELTQMVNNIHLDPRIPYSVKVTRFLAGGKNINIIPGHASFGLDLRAQTNEAMAELVGKVERIVESLANLYQVDLKIVERGGIAAAEIRENAIGITREAIRTVLGEEGVGEPLLTTGGDDFHFYTIKKPELEATMVGLGCDLEPGLHHPKMRFNHQAMLIGARILYQSILNVYNLKD